MIDYKIAKQYLELGMSIFPVNLKRGGDGKILKLPAVPWKPYQHRKPTKEELHEWFDKKQYNGIGMATGYVSGMVVIDVEHDATREILKGLSKDMWSRTISGGSHHYYRWSKELRNTVKIMGDQVDFRGDGGYVVLPPSSFGDSGYEWVEGPTPPMFLSELPEEIEKALTARPDPVVKNYKKDIYSEETIFRTAQQGERNMMAAQVAGTILKMVDKRFWEPYGWLILKDWNDINEPPLKEKELRITWNSIKKAEKRNGLFTVTDQKFEIFSGKEAEQKYDEVRSKYEGGITTGFEPLDDFFTLLPGQLYLVSAQTHEGKTTLALNLAARVASFNHKTIFASLEQSYQIIPRVQSVVGGEIPDTFSILTTGEMLAVETFRRICEEYSPDFLVIDHIQFVEKAGRGQTEDMDEAILKIQQLAHEAEIPILVVAHTRKINNKSRDLTLDDLRSSSSLSQVPAVVILLKKQLQDGELSTTANRVNLSIAKNRVTGKLGTLSFKMSRGGKIEFA